MTHFKSEIASQVVAENFLVGNLAIGQYGTILHRLTSTTI